MKAEQKAKIYAQGVLKPEKHDRLLDEIDRISKRAGLYGLQEYIWQTFPTTGFGEAELAYLKNFGEVRNLGLHGFVYLDFPDEHISRRMLQVCGLLVRNLVDARVMSRSEILNALRYEGEVTGSAILIPNFCPDPKADKKSNLLGEKGPSDYSEYQKEAMYDFLLKKLRDGGQVIINAVSYETVGKVYGSAIRGHIEQYFGEGRNGTSN